MKTTTHRRVRATGTRLGGLLVLLVGLGASACSEGHTEEPQVASEPSTAKVTIAPREGHLKDFPCLECHSKFVTGKPKVPATHRAQKFQHFEAVEKCVVCHNTDNFNELLLNTGESISFNESYRICGQCHSEKLADWNIGAHGKHVGSWQSDRTRYTCVDCHNPHSPAREQVTAKPAPPFPKLGIPKGEH